MTIDEIRDLPRPVFRSEVAALLECDVRTVDRAIEAGVIKAFRLGRKVYIPTKPFIELVEKGNFDD